MKLPLEYQTTELDCVPTTIINGIRYLFEREEIPPEAIKIIYLYSLDTKNKNGKIGGRGTSGIAVQLICNSLNEVGNFNLSCEFCLEESVTIKNIEDCLNKDGVVISRVAYENNLFHYILVTGLDYENVYAFDPYYKTRIVDKKVKVVHEEPYRYNRIISKERFVLDKNDSYAIGDTKERECIFMYRKK